MTEPDYPTFSKLFEWAWAGVLALVGVIYHKQDGEINRQRDNVAKLFDKIAAHAERSEDRHRELLNALHAGLEKKADK